MVACSIYSTDWSSCQPLSPVAENHTIQGALTLVLGLVAPPHTHTHTCTTPSLPQSLPLSVRDPPGQGSCYLFCLQGVGAFFLIRGPGLPPSVDKKFSVSPPFPSVNFLLSFLIGPLAPSGEPTTSTRTLLTPFVTVIFPAWTLSPACRSYLCPGFSEQGRKGQAVSKRHPWLPPGHLSEYPFVL